MSLIRIKSRCLWGWISSGRSGGNVFAGLFRLLEAAHSPRLTVPSSLFKASKEGVSPSLPLCLSCLPLSPRGALVITRIMQDPLSSSKSLTSSHLQSPSCREGKYSQVWGIRICTSLGAIILPTRLPWTRPLAFLGLRFFILRWNCK